MPYQWLYSPIIEITTIEYVIDMLGNIIKLLKIPPTITVSVCYYTSELSSAEQWTSGLGRFLECWGCDMLVMTWALVLCLIRVCSPLGAVHPWVCVMLIYQARHSCLCYNLHIYIHICIYTHLYICVCVYIYIRDVTIYWYIAISWYIKPVI